jgi:GNAT superfamily N-acetyltransferase
VIGCPVDVRQVPCFSDIAYFAAFGDMLDAYPAHLHVNVAPDWQGHGIGRALVRRTIAACREAGARGVHVVTAADAPTIGFYEACGFGEVARRNGPHRPLIMLGFG